MARDTSIRISVLTEDLKEQIAAAAKSGGLCLARFKADVVLHDANISDMLPGFRFAVGGTTFEVAPERKKCHPECPLAANNTPCCLAGRYVFAVPVKKITTRCSSAVCPRNTYERN